MKVGYARVSTLSQNIARQEDFFKEIGCEKIFIDKMSGKDKNRPALKEMMEFVREGDTVVVKELSRLGRSAKDVLDIVEDMKSKGVELYLEEFRYMGEAQKSLMLGILASFAEFERALILERQGEGIRAFVGRGGKMGRKRLILPLEQIIEDLNNGIKASFLLKKYKINKTTFYSRIKRNSNGTYERRYKNID